MTALKIQVPFQEKVNGNRRQIYDCYHKVESH